ncbi:calpastatin isoform X33 [Salmo salar]|uniref:Calpastatin n=1 Tax=Salmo salar TaxID=8030 RepID=A0ABM3DQB0_SALSA|nr:calpastatin isoform X33 [Salmo salar]
MPRKKRSHAHHKKSQGQRTAPSTTLGEQQVDDRPYNTQAAAASKAQPAFDCCQCFKKAPKGYQELPSESFPPELFHPSSQPRQYSPTSVAQVAVNPAQFESASAASTMATKPGAVSVTMGGATASGATAGGSPTTAGTTQRGTAKVAMPETALVSPAGATIIDIPTPGTKGSPKDTPKPAPMHPAKATPPTTGGGIIVVEAVPPWKAEVPTLQESLKQTAKSVPTTSSKVDMAKKDPAKLVTAVAAPAAAAGAASLKGPQTKKVEDLAAIDASSAGFSNFAPPPPAPIKKAEEFKSAPVTKSPAPPIDKKAKVEKLADDFSLMSGLDSPLDTKPKTAESVPTTSSKVDMAKKDPAKLVTAVAAPAAAAGDASLKGPQTKVQVEVVPPGAKAAKELAPMHPAKATPPTTGGGIIVVEAVPPWKAEVPTLQESLKQTAKSVPTTSSKVDMAKKDPAKLVTAVAAPAAAAGDASLKGPQTKVQVEVVPPGAKAAKELAPMHPAKATPPTTGGGIIVVEAVPPWKAEVPTLQESLKQTAKSVPTTSSKVDMAKKDPAKLVTAVAAPAAAAGDASLKGPQTKVQVEVVPPGAKAAKEELAVDPFDALADSLPSSESFAPAAHVYTGPEVIEHGLTSKKGVICGGDDCPLPPGYRSEDMAPVADVKPKDVPKPMSTDEALDSLSFGFTTSMAPIPQKQEKKVEDLGAIDALSAGFSNFASPPPAPIKKAEEFKSAPVTKSPAPPIDKKAKVEKLADDFSLMSGLDSPLDTKPKTAEIVPTTSSKVDMAKKDPAKLVTAVAAPAAAAGDASLKGPQTKKVEDLAAIEASSAGFSNFAPPPPAPIKKAEEFKSAPVTKSPAPPIDKKAKVEKFADDFSLMSGLDSPLDTKPKTAEGGSMSLDALSALGDSLPAPEPAPQPPKIRHEDIVMEGKLTSKKGVFVGERDDTLPPKYRFTENKVKDLPPLKPEAMAEAKVQAVVRPKQPSMDDSEALDLLSRDLSSSAGPAAASVAVTTEQRQPRLEPMSAPVLDDLAGTLLPDAPVFKSKGDKPKSKSRSKSKKQREEDPSSIDHLSGQLSSDVVSASTNKGGKS